MHPILRMSKERTRAWRRFGAMCCCAISGACADGGPTSPGVAEGPVNEVRITPDPITMEVDVPHRASAVTLNGQGLQLQGRPVSWSVLDSSVASVTGAGVVTSLAVGSTTLIATSEGISGSATLDVVASASQPAGICALVGSGWESHTQLPFAQSSLGTLEVVMLFADFDDAPANEATAPLHDLLIPTAQSWLSEVSQGRFNISVDVVDQWFRAPQASGTYDWRTYEGHRLYISQVMALADPSVDFSPYDAVFIVASAGVDQDRSPTFRANPGGGVMADGVEIRTGVTFGADVRLNIGPSYGASITVHETGHMIGLPDLYLFNASSWLSSLSAAGMWDPMSWHGLGTHFVTWHKWKLGWLDGDRIDCLGAATVERTVWPFDAPSGPQAVVIPTSSQRALVLEARRARGFDSLLCEEGVLIYAVNVNTADGQGPVRVQSARADRDVALSQGGSCGPLYESSHGVGSGRISSHVDPSGVTVDVLDDLGDAFRVRITHH